MPRPRKTPAAAAESAAPAIEIDNSKLTIGDLLTFQKLAGMQKASAEEQSALMLEALPMLDRLVVGGVAHRPLSELPQVMEGVAAAFKAAGNPKN